MRGHLNFGRMLGRIILLAVLALSASSSYLSGEEPKTAPLPDAKIRVTVDRVVGLVPLTITISGVMFDEDNREIELSEDQRVFVGIGTAAYRVVSSERSQSLVSAGVAEIDSAGVATPMVRELVINRPGTYKLWLILKDSEGNQIRSNKIKVKAM